MEPQSLGHLPVSSFRELCKFIDGNYIKDLSIFDVPLNHIIIVDNNPLSFRFQPENAIQSSTWMGQRDDLELKNRILPILFECLQSNDVRETIRSYRE